MNNYLVATMLAGSIGAGSAAASETGAPSPVVVHVKDFKYAPSPLKIHAGDTVTFVNDDSEAHTISASDKTFDSAGLDSNGTWKHTFAEAGTFAYFCELHPYMKGTIVVAPREKRS